MYSDLMWKKKAASDSHDVQLLASVVLSPGVDSSVLFGWEVSATQPDFFPEDVLVKVIAPHGRYEPPPFFFFFKVSYY